MPNTVLKDAKKQWMAVDRITKKTPFMGLFPDQPDKIEAISEHMKKFGFDTSQPIILWDCKELEPDKKNPFYIIDGHTRYDAAKKANLNTGVYVSRVKFRNEKEALEYAIHKQRDRRNMDNAALMKCIKAVDSLKRKGQRTDLASSEAKSGKSADETAKAVGTSKTKVEKVRTIETHADDKTKEAVKSGKKSINKAYNEVQEKRKSKANKPRYLEPKEAGKKSDLQAEPNDSTVTTTEPAAVTWESLATILAGIGLFLTNHKTPPDDLENREDVVSAIRTHIQFLDKHLDEIV